MASLEAIYHPHIPHTVLVAAFAYEAVSLLPHSPLPPISRLCWRHKALTPFVVAVLTAHLAIPPTPTPTKEPPCP